MTVYQNIGGTTAQVGVSRTTLGVTFNMGQDDGTVIDTQLYNANSVCTVQLLTINNTFTAINTTNCPTLANSGGVFIVPPTGNASTITLKGVTGDTGIPLNVSAPTFVCLPNPPVAFGIATNGSVLFKLVWV
jgi:hypothetical protein